LQKNAHCELRVDIWFYDWKTDLETPEKNFMSLILNSKQY